MTRTLPMRRGTRVSPVPNEIGGGQGQWSTEIEVRGRSPSVSRTVFPPRVVYGPLPGAFRSWRRRGRDCGLYGGGTREGTSVRTKTPPDTLDLVGMVEKRGRRTDRGVQGQSCEVWSDPRVPSVVDNGRDPLTWGVPDGRTFVEVHVRIDGGKKPPPSEVLEL